MLNHILAALNDYTFAFNQDEGNYSYISNNIAELAGYNKFDFEKDTNLWFSLIDDRDINKVEEQYDKPLANDNSVSITYRIKTASGQINWVNEKRCLYTEDTGQNILLSIVKDLQREDGESYSREDAIAGYGILFDNNPNPMWIYEISSLRFLKVNTTAVKTYGYSETEFLTMTIQDIRPNADQGNLNNFLRSRGDDETEFKGYSNSGVWRHMTKNGELLHAEVYGDTIQYKHYDCRLVVATNVTERLYYQEEAKIREQFLNSLIDSQTNFLIRIDITGHYTFVNKRFLKIFGYNRADIIGNHFSATTIPEENYLCEEAFYNCINNPGKIIHLVHKKPDSKGKLHDTEWEFIAIANEDREVTGIQGIGQDITDRINTQNEIAWTRSSLEAIINNTEDLIWSVDRSFCYLYMNQSFKNIVAMLTGIVPKTGDNSLYENFDEEMINKWQNYYTRAFEGEAYVVENELTDPETGEIYYYETSFNPIYSSVDTITGIGCFSRNISERIKARKAIINQNERLQHIASLSSHELRRPVATMLGLINILDKDNFSNPDNKEIIEHLLVTGNEIDDVIRLIVNKTFI